MRLIDADAYLKKICTYTETGCGSCKMQTVCPLDEPIIKIMPETHGKWEDCPKCDTKMDLKEGK